MSWLRANPPEVHPPSAAPARGWLRKIKSPYVVIALGYLIGAFLNMFITSATSLGLLLMATMYPVLRGLGLSRLSAAAPIATSGALELGPTQSNVIYAAGQSGLDVIHYVFSYQVPVAVPAILVMAVLHFFWQKIMDRREATPPGVEPAGLEEQIEEDARRLLLPPHAEPMEEQAETGAEFFPGGGRGRGAGRSQGADLVMQQIFL